LFLVQAFAARFFTRLPVMIKCHGTDAHVNPFFGNYSHFVGQSAKTRRMGKPRHPNQGQLL
jgi:hypothetical protein